MVTPIQHLTRAAEKVAAGDFSEKVDNCVGFTLEYHLIAENIGLRDYVLGPRTVYVNNGEEWIAVGEFPYPALGAVRAEVYLPEPMDLVAVGTIADCHTPNIFDFRQTVKRFLISDDGQMKSDS